MPESKGRAKASYTPPQRKAKAQVGNPPWFVPVMVRPVHPGTPVDRDVLRHPGRLPDPGAALWNLAVGFGLLMAGFVMTTRWR